MYSCVSCDSVTCGSVSQRSVNSADSTHPSILSLIKSLYSKLHDNDGVKDASLKAKAKTKDFHIVLEDPRGRGLVLDDSNTATRWPKNCLKTTTENKTTSVTKYFKTASSSVKADTLNIWFKNRRMWQLLWINNRNNKHIVSCCLFLKMCYYRSSLVFNIVAFKTLTFHKAV